MRHLVLAAMMAVGVGWSMGIGGASAVRANGQQFLHSAETASRQFHEPFRRRREAAAGTATGGAVVFQNEAAYFPSILPGEIAGAARCAPRALDPLKFSRISSPAGSFVPAVRLLKYAFRPAESS